MSDAATIEGSLLDPAVHGCPFPYYQQLHENAPVYRMPETGFYLVSTYEGIRAVVSDTETFSNHLAIERLAGESGADFGKLYNEHLSEVGWGHVQTLHRTDPPAHGRYRRLMNRAFTPAMVRGMVPGLERTSTELIDAFIDRGECDFVTEYAFPLPGIVIGEQIGLDSKDLETFKKWADAMLATAQGKLVDEESARYYAEIEAEAQHYFEPLLLERMKNPRGDLMSAFVAQPDGDDEPMTMGELMDLMNQMITGGYVTTADAISNALLLLIENPDQMELLRGDKSLLRNFADETLRRASSVQGLFRRAAKDTELLGVQIPKDSVIHLRFGAANMDQAEFPDPDRFDILRPNSRNHLSFSRGAHFCVGQPLAMQEIITAFDHILDRMDNIALAPGAEAVRSEGWLFYGLSTLPITFTARG